MIFFLFCFVYIFSFLRSTSFSPLIFSPSFELYNKILNWMGFAVSIDANSIRRMEER